MKKSGLMGASAALGMMTALERSKGRYMRAPDGHPTGANGGDDVVPGALNIAIKAHFATIEEKFGPLPDVVKAACERLDAIEQKYARSGATYGDAHQRRSFGQLATDDRDADIKALASHRGRLSLPVKAIITSLTTDADGSAGDLIAPARQPIWSMPKRRFTMRDLLPVISVESGTIEVPKQTGRTIGAATVAEGVTKPQSELKYDLVQVPTRTIAHWVLASRQVLADVPQLQGLIDTELLYGLKYVEDNQILNGAGTGTDLNGIYTQATAFSTSMTVPGPTMIDVIGLALLQSSLADYPPDGIVLHPSDWVKIRLSKNVDGDYIMGPPGVDMEPRLFGLPVALTKAQTADKFLVGAFEEGATLYDREEARVEISTEDSDNFRKNLVTVLAEERVALHVKDVTAFTKGDFSDAITAVTPA